MRTARAKENSSTAGSWRSRGADRWRWWRSGWRNRGRGRQRPWMAPIQIPSRKAHVSMSRWLFPALRRGRRRRMTDAGGKEGGGDEFQISEEHFDFDFICRWPVSSLGDGSRLSDGGEFDLFHQWITDDAAGGERRDDQSGDAHCLKTEAEAREGFLPGFARSRAMTANIVPVWSMTRRKVNSGAGWVKVQ